MNVEVLIRWGRKTLTFFDTQPLERWQGLDQELLEAQVRWICGFRAHLHEWGELLQIIEVTESFVRTHGLYRDAHEDLQDLLAPLARAQRTKKVQHHLLAFVAEQSFQAKPNERLLGSSEVIESVFGTLKRLEHDQAKSGFTGLLLGIGAVVSPTTPEVVHKALATVTTKMCWTGATTHSGNLCRQREEPRLLFLTKRNKNGINLKRLYELLFHQPSLSPVVVDHWSLSAERVRGIFLPHLHDFRGISTFFDGNSQTARNTRHTFICYLGE